MRRCAQGECSKLLDDAASAVRAAGYAHVMLDTLPGYGAVSVPVWDARDAVAYALTITAPTELIDRNPAGKHIGTLLATGRELSRLLGAPPTRWAEPAGQACR